MKTLAFVDTGNLFYGIKRISGDPRARVDYHKLKKMFRTSKKDLFLAYVSTPELHGQPVRNDSAFVALLTNVGYCVRRHFPAAKLVQGRVTGRMAYPRGMWHGDARQHIVAYDRVVLVTGKGVGVEVAEMAKAEGREVIVASFDRVGDLNPELEAQADKVVTLEADLKWVPRG